MSKTMILFLVAGILLFILLLAGGILFVVRTTITSSGAYQKSIEFIQKDPVVASYLGSVQSFGWMPTGRIKGTGQGGHASLFIKVYGEKKDGRVQMELTSLGYGWQIDKAVLADQEHPSGLILFEKKP